MNEYDVSKAFQEVEDLLIKSMTRNLGKHVKDQDIEGFDWTMWQAEQLKSFRQFREENKKEFGGYFSTINQDIEETLKKANATGRLQEEQKILKALKSGYKAPLTSGQGVEGAFLKINDRKLKTLIRSTTDDMKVAETAVLRMTNDKYRKIIFNAQVYANSGAGTVWQAVDMATKDFLAAGINCVEYKNGARVNIASYAEMAIRTANKRAFLVGEGSKRDEWGIHTVLVSQYGACSPTCLPWQGKVYIDDVFSGGKSDGKYPLLSTAISGGLFHPNCRHTTNTFFEGINTVPNQKDAAKTTENSVLEQKQRYNERQIRKYKRLEQGSLDQENKEKHKLKKMAWEKRNRDFISGHSEVLRRDYARENTRGIIAKEQKFIPNPVIALKKSLAEDINKLTNELPVFDSYKDLVSVWKDPVSVKDYQSKKADIEAKKDYFKTKIIDANTSQDKKDEFIKKMEDLNDWEVKGIDYETKKTRLDELRHQLDTLTPSRLKPKETEDVYSQKSKNAALWAKSTKEADAKLRQKSGEVWKHATAEEREAIYNYTSGSGSFNRPLAGYKKPWSEYGEGWENNYYVGSDKVWIDYEGKGDKIRKMTDLITQSEYDFDMWLQRGCNENALEKFFDVSSIKQLSEDELQKFIGHKNTFDNFISTAVNKGSGFSSKPVIMNIYAPKGTKMMYVEPFSAFGNGDGLGWDGIKSQGSFGTEAEMIIQRGATYRVTKIEKNNGKLYIDVEVRQEKGYNMFQQDPTEWTGPKDGHMD